MPHPSPEPTILYTAILLLTLPATALLLAKAVHLLATRRAGYARTRPGRCAEAATLCLSVAVVTLTFANLSGFDTRPTRACVTARTGRDAAQAYRDGGNDGITIVSRTLPPSTLCTWPDGTTVQLVPSWVDPVLLLSLAGAAGSAAMGCRAAVGKGRSGRTRRAYPGPG
ncbi:hypothetical protein [Streptomyces sp. NBC_00083]|uniref:hypothetical protein n=1 Tax=Streptomyces sp. NBC_00083 TaxID=2975647 RepID=UPI0022588D27|nr:hypothetical protein [Streptomyces sp. NBC_00083]MCX5385269.1 hypothetical protein [Streptomyces sp. NBC_00083]